MYVFTGPIYHKGGLMFTHSIAIEIKSESVSSTAKILATFLGLHHLS